ncbi:MAG: DNA ligase [Desulfobacteraceae bacterium 4572_35.1]|nr:MAG: DNA ligase [Desulfobacteraceae bacterium 4572_35.1]
MPYLNKKKNTTNAILTSWCFFILIYSISSLSSIACAFEPMLPRVYSTQIDVTGWLMSEKLDGVRGYWDGKQLYSKNGNLLYPPADFTQNLPNFPLEGELWGGHNTFEQTIAIVQRKKNNADWLKLKFAIFDAPAVAGGFIQRIAKAQKWFIDHPSNYAFIIKQTKVHNTKQLQNQLATIEKAGGEGLIVRKADASYIKGRSHSILKVKSYQDAEATVIDHLPGKGRNNNRLGALLVELENGIRFRLGSGFSDHEREHPPAIGESITFKYYGNYTSGIPKFPSYIRLRRDTVHKITTN